MEGRSNKNILLLLTTMSEEKCCQSTIINNSKKRKRVWKQSETAWEHRKHDREVTTDKGRRKTQNYRPAEQTQVGKRKQTKEGSENQNPKIMTP